MPDKESFFREYLSDASKSELKHDILELSSELKDLAKRVTQTELQNMHRHSELMLVNEATSHRINAVIQRLEQVDIKAAKLEKDVEVTGQHRVADILAKSQTLEEENRTRIRFWVTTAAKAAFVIATAVVAHYWR